MEKFYKGWMRSLERDFIRSGDIIKIDFIIVKQQYSLRIYKNDKLTMEMVVGQGSYSLSVSLDNTGANAYIESFEQYIC